MRVVVTGGAGLLRSRPCGSPPPRSDEGVCVHHPSTGQLSNVMPLLPLVGFEFVHADVSAALEITGRVDAVAHLASPASPPDYLRLPLETLAAGSRGTENALALARANGARYVLAST